MMTPPRLRPELWAIENGASGSDHWIIGPAPRERQPVRVLQFGEGRLLRTLIDTAFEELRRARVWQGLIAMTSCRPQGAANIRGLKEQAGYYTALLLDDQSVRAEVVGGVIPMERDQEWDVIVKLAESVQWMVTNATESGIVVSPKSRLPTDAPDTVVGMVTAALWHRWCRQPSGVLGFLPTELVPRNGDRWREAVLAQAVAWDLPPAFGQWVTQSVVFFNTLVDRVVTQPTDVSSWWAKLGYRDDFLTLGEQYGRWWIEKPASNVLALPWPRMSVVDIVDRLDGYHQLKVFGLNGVHLLIACQGLLNGHQTVSEAFSDPAIREPAEAYWRVVEPVIALPPPTVQAFIDALRHRFSQPWLPHRLEDIAVRLVDKWWIRVAPSLDWWWDHHRQLPEPLVTVTRALLQYELQRDVSAQWHREWILQTLRLTPDDGLAWHCELVQQLSGDG